MLNKTDLYFKVRKMYNDKGQPIEEAPPSTPVEIIGFKDLPIAGDEILQVDSEVSICHHEINHFMGTG